MSRFEVCQNNSHTKSLSTRSRPIRSAGSPVCFMSPGRMRSKRYLLMQTLCQQMTGLNSSARLRSARGLTVKVTAVSVAGLRFRSRLPHSFGAAVWEIRRRMGDSCHKQIRKVGGQTPDGNIIDEAKSRTNTSAMSGVASVLFSPAPDVRECSAVVTAGIEPGSVVAGDWTFWFRSVNNEGLGPASLLTEVGSLFPES